MEEYQVQCPYCRQSIQLEIDMSVANQEYIEDCSVCCRPITVTVDAHDPQDLQVNVSTEDD